MFQFALFFRAREGDHRSDQRSCRLMETKKLLPTPTFFGLFIYLNQYQDISTISPKTSQPLLKYCGSIDQSNFAGKKLCHEVKIYMWPFLTSKHDCRANSSKKIHPSLNQTCASYDQNRRKNAKATNLKLYNDSNILWPTHLP